MGRRSVQADGRLGEPPLDWHRYTLTRLADNMARRLSIVVTCSEFPH
jgi:hypothetical protein